MDRKWRILVLASLAELLAEGIWFSFAPFTSSIGEEFSLSLAGIGLLASAAIWIVPLGRMTSGFMSDKYGATKMYSSLLVIVGFFSIASAFAESYSLFFVLRIFVSLGGITLVVGMQHISQWFPENQYGLAEGVFAASGTLGAAVGALTLPIIFGNWAGPIFQTGFRAAFFYLGGIAILFGVVYYLFTEAAATKEIARKTAERASLTEEIFMMTRFGVIALAFGYVLAYGLEAAMNTWLPTYFQTAFGSSVILAGAFASSFPFVIAFTRPYSGYVSDWLHKNEVNMFPILRERYREQWILFCLGYTILMLFGLTLAGRSGNIVLTVIAVSQVALGSGFGSGAIFALVPEMFPERSGAASGIIAGFGASGGILFPLIFGWSSRQGFIHGGYSIVAVLLVPILLLITYVFGPNIEHGNPEKGFYYNEKPE